jgi:L-asparaginase
MDKKPKFLGKACVFGPALLRHGTIQALDTSRFIPVYLGHERMTERPYIALVTTGGTIAGLSLPHDPHQYEAGLLDAQALLAALPESGDYAPVLPSPLFNIDSRNMGPSEWLILMQHVRGLMDRTDVQSVVITHGTDTLEETAYFLYLTLPSTKPVIITAAMRAADQTSADGPMNLWQALRTARRPELSETGVLVVLNDGIWAARDIEKRHPSRITAFDGGPGFLGDVDAPRLTWMPVREGRKITLTGIHQLPRVDLLWIYGGADPHLVHSCIERGASGVVLALPGNASLPDLWAQCLSEVRLPIALCSRTGAGVLRPRDLPPNQFLCPGGPLKTRIRMMLGLASGKRASRLGEWLNPA